jgi:hypothetical protein
VFVIPGCGSRPRARNPYPQTVHVLYGLRLWIPDCRFAASGMTVTLNQLAL